MLLLFVCYYEDIEEVTRIKKVELVVYVVVGIIWVVGLADIISKTASFALIVLYNTVMATLVACSVLSSKNSHTHTK